jgi:O-succinylbenzoate synthase
MTVLRSIELREITLPLREPFQISSGTTTHRRILLLELTDREGHSVWSECVAGERPNYAPETIDVAWVVLREYVAPRVLDTEITDPLDVAHRLGRDFRGHLMARAAVEMGLWALEAVRTGVPLARLIGGERERIEVGVSIGIQPDPDTLAAKAAARLAEGYRKIKLKVKPGADLEWVRGVRAALGPEAPLMVDANNAYTLEDIHTLEAFDELGLVMIEQPLAWDDLVQHAELQRRLRTPICLDESITGLDRARDMVTLGSGRIINIKPGRVGGFGPSIAIHDFCRGRSIPVWCGGMLESGVGRAYNVALASLGGFTIPGDISPSARYWERDIVTPEWVMDERGTMAVPRSEPGRGVAVDRDRIEDLTVRTERLTGHA